MIQEKSYQLSEKHQGRSYISSAFTSIKINKCKPINNWLDNDPHFWNSPPTWGICRTGFKKNLGEGDYVFFVLPNNSELPQMIYAYMRIEEKITHLDAYPRFPQKRMGNKNPNGNIIVNQDGSYSKFDLEIHKDRFNEITNYYLVGSKSESKFLTSKEIEYLSRDFLKILQQVFNTNLTTIFKIIGRKGRVLNPGQIQTLLNWLNN